MLARQLPRTDYRALKAAFRMLVDEVGGPVAAARITRVSATQLANYGDGNQDAVFAPIDVVADLEAELGEPIVTAKLADLSQRDVVPRSPAASVEAEHLARHLGDVSKAMAETVSTVGVAVSDGRVTAEEMRQILKTVAAAHTQLAELSRDVGMALEGQPAGLRVVGAEG